MDKGKILLIGDSITEGFELKKFLPEFDAINKGVSGDSTVECLKRINKKFLNGKPDKIFICIGTNDFARDRNDDTILENIKKIIEKILKISHFSKVYITSIFPTRFNSPRPNQRITNFNIKLKELSSKTGCSFFDIHDSFTDNLGMLKESYTNDGLHLNDTAYIKWAEVLKSLLLK